MTDKDFYTACADILDIPHTYTTPVRRTRWTNRRLGNGRFPGYGLIRCFGKTVMITTRSGTITLPDKETALAHIKTTAPAN